MANIKLLAPAGRTGTVQAGGYTAAIDESGCVSIDETAAPALINAGFSRVQTVTDGLVAKAGGGRSGATVLVAPQSHVTTVATAADSVVLPKAVVGLSIETVNSGANSMQVFANGSDTIDGTAGATGVAHAAGKSAKYSCVQAGVWKRLLSA